MSDMNAPFRLPNVSDAVSLSLSETRLLHAEGLRDAQCLSVTILSTAVCTDELRLCICPPVCLSAL